MIPYKIGRGEVKVGNKKLLILSCYNCESPIGTRWINEDNSITDDINRGWNYCPYCGISKEDFIGCNKI